VIAPSRLALLLLERCHARSSSAELRERIAKARATLSLEEKVAARPSARVSLALHPTNAIALLHGVFLPPSYANLPLLDQDELVLPLGSYTLEVSATGFLGETIPIKIDSPDREFIPVRLQRHKAPTSASIDFGAEAGPELGGIEQVADPHPKVFRSLLAKRYREAPSPTPWVAKRERAHSNLTAFLVAGASVGLHGFGIVMYLGDNKTIALASVGSGLALGGVATYLFYREHDASPSPVTAQLGNHSMQFSWQTAF